MGASSRGWEPGQKEHDRRHHTETTVQNTALTGHAPSRPCSRREPSRPSTHTPPAVAVSHTRASGAVGRRAAGCSSGLARTRRVHGTGRLLLNGVVKRDEVTALRRGGQRPAQSQKHGLLQGWLTTLDFATCSCVQLAGLFIGRTLNCITAWLGQGEVGTGHARGRLFRHMPGVQ